MFSVLICNFVFSQQCEQQWVCNMILMPFSMIRTNGVLSHCVYVNMPMPDTLFIIFCTAKWLHICSSAAGVDPAPLGDEQDSEVDNALVRCVGWTIYSDWNYIILWHLPPTHTHVHTHAYTHTMHTRTTHAHTHAHTHCTHTCTHTLTCTHTHVHTLTCTHTHTGSVGCWNAGKPEVSGAARLGWSTCCRVPFASLSFDYF